MTQDSLLLHIEHMSSVINKASMVMQSAIEKEIFKYMKEYYGLNEKDAVDYILKNIVKFNRHDIGRDKSEYYDAERLFLTIEKNIDFLKGKMELNVKRNYLGEK
jgi:hypothetical protein